jgi:FixJ family two-component response regulator
MSVLEATTPLMSPMRQLVSPQIPIVHIIEDPKKNLDNLVQLIHLNGYHAVRYANGEEFLNHFKSGVPGVLLIDVSLPDMSGLDLHDHLNNKKIKIPVIYLSAHSEISLAVTAIKQGAADFLSVPTSNHVLLTSLRQAINQDIQRHSRLAILNEIKSRINRLSGREYEIMQLIKSGLNSREIAAELKISARTVEFHRSNVMKKMQAKSIVELTSILVSGNFC